MEIRPVFIRLGWQQMMPYRRRESRSHVALAVCRKRFFLHQVGQNQIIRQLCQRLCLGRNRIRRHIISTAFEHHAVLHTLRRLKEQGFEIQLLDVGAEGNITAAQVEEAIRPDTCLVTVMFANNEIGSVLPIAEIGEACRAHGVLFHTDAVQAAGHIPVNVKKQNIDMLSLSAHKFHGPKRNRCIVCETGD